MSEYRRFDKGLPDLNGKSILLTGGTGSFGNAFVSRVLDIYQPEKLIVYSRDEQKQYDMESVYPLSKYECMRYFVGDVRDQDRLELAFRDVDYVVHAAALKIVPTAEYNPFECVKTNIIGAENIVKAAINSGVRKVVNISTDKAANPINLYGATKLAAEKIFTAANMLSGKGGGRFATVRYGNVIGSRGSVIPFFKKLVADGAPVLPITDERMTRFMITLEQGVHFVLSSIATMSGGEVFVPKIPSARVIDIANAVSTDIPQTVVGIRPGEKIHEVLITSDEARYTLEHEDRYTILPNSSVIGSSQVDQRVSDEFEYTSDNNAEWIDAGEIRELSD